ncbi:hypothetical protein [Tenacibaculum sp.]|uniref:hypothetical protein n=1 Tax=Tenacibaculum sp. TaxID=1906242 RepID=UPI003D14724C
MEKFKFQGVEYNIPESGLDPRSNENIKVCQSTEDCSETTCEECLFSQDRKNTVAFKAFVEQSNEDAVHSFGDSL